MSQSAKASVTVDPLCGGITAAYVYAAAHMTGIRSFLLSALVAVLAACGDDPSTEIVCSGGTTGGLAAGATVETVEVAGDGAACARACEARASASSEPVDSNVNLQKPEMLWCSIVLSSTPTWEASWESSSE